MVRSTILAQCGRNFQILSRIYETFLHLRQKKYYSNYWNKFNVLYQIFIDLRGRYALSFLDKIRKFWSLWDTHRTALLLSSKESLVNFKNKTFPQTIEAFSTPYSKVRQFENDRKLCAQSNVGIDLSKLKRTSCINVALDNFLT